MLPEEYGIQEPMIAIVERVPEGWDRVVRLPPFKVIDECPKCESPTLRTEHHNGLHLSAPCGKQYAEYAQANDWAFPEHLCRSCPRCGYGWCEQVRIKG